MSVVYSAAMPAISVPALAPAQLLAAPQPAMAVLRQGRPVATPGSRRSQSAAGGSRRSRGLLSPHDLASMPVAFRGNAAGAKRRILCFGDSLTAGLCSNGHQFEPYGRAMVDALAAKGIAAEVVMSGHSGRTAQEMVAAAEGTIVDVCGGRGKGLARILREEGQFDFAIIMAGTNDMGHGLPEQQILRDLRALHQLCHKHGVATAALMPPPLSAAKPNPARESKRLRLCKAIAKLCSTMPHTVACMDPAELVPANNAIFWERDTLHFSPAGSRCLGQRLATLVVEKLSEEQKIDDGAMKLGQNGRTSCNRHQAKEMRSNAKMVETPAPEPPVQRMTSTPRFVTPTPRSPRFFGEALTQRGCNRSLVALTPRYSNMQVLVR